MKKLPIVLLVIIAFSTLFLYSCTQTPTQSSLLQSSQSNTSVSNNSQDISEESEDTGSSNEESLVDSSEISASVDSSDPISSELVSSNFQSEVDSSLSQSSSSMDVSSETSSEPGINIIARFKLTGGEGDVLLEDMDGLGYIGTCPLEYVNSQNDETIKNAEWKTDSKFVNYFNTLHTATKILFDSSVDAPEEERSTRMQTQIPFTVSAWIKPNTYTPAGSPDFRVIAAYGSNGPIDHWDLKLLSNNELSFYHSAIASEDQPYDSGYILEDNNWYHVAVIFDDSSIRYYVNGNLVSTKQLNGEMEFIVTRGNFAIGGLVEGAYSFRGGIAEVCIFEGVVLPQNTTRYPIG